MNGLSWTIEHQCPQCGAPVILEETDRILTCAFCRTRLFINTADYFRYYIPPPGGPNGDTIFIPYWRFRGLAYTFEPLNMTERYIDTNLCAIGMPGLPSSLGLRPQAMTLKFISPDTQGVFLRPSLAIHELMPDTNRSAQGSRHHELFIGETTSLIYTPMILKQDTLVDPFLHQSVTGWHPDDRDRYPPEDKGNHPQFIPTLCPQCGWDLTGEKNTLVLTCGNCHTAWTCDKGPLQQIPFAVITGSGAPLIYIPFWRVKPRITGLKAQTFADLIQLANLPRAITAAMEDMPLHFWSPAFKVNPSLFLRWSRQMTIFQMEDTLDDLWPSAMLSPVTLTPAEAAESILITLGSMVIDKRAFFKGLPDIRVDAQESLLVYHPFVIGDRELTHERMGLVMEKNALKYGATM